MNGPYTGNILISSPPHLSVSPYPTQASTSTVRRVNGEVAPSTQTAANENSRSQASGERGRSGLTTESGDQRREVTISQILVIIVVVFLVTQSFKVCFPIKRSSENDTK